MNSPLISTIIPTFNSGKFIKDTIESIFNQTYNNIEIIVFDDNSTDSTIKICESFSRYSNFKLIKAGYHTGNIAKARNFAINNSNGEYVAFLDSDDLWEQNKIEEQMKYTDDNDFICSNAKVIDENNNIISEVYFSNIVDLDKIRITDLLIDNLVITSSVLSKKELIIKAGYFSESLGNLAEDYALWLNIVKINEIKYIKESLTRYRRHKSNSSFKDDLYRVEMLKETVKLRNQYVSKDNIELHKVAIKGIMTIKNELAEIYLNNNMFKDSLKNINYILRYYIPKLSFQYLTLYFKFTYLLLKKIIKGVY